MNEELRQLVLDLCGKVDEVVHNSDWPTEEGSRDENGNCPLLDLTQFIRTKLNG